MALDSGLTDDDRGPQLMALYWVMSAVSVIILALRFWGRMLIRQLGADDFVMLFTLILFLILASFVTFLASIGGCRHLFFLTPVQQLRAVKYNWIAQPWGIFGFATGKAAVALLTLRLLPPNSHVRKWILWISIGSVLIINALGCIMTFVQCSPPRALWMPQLVASGEATCWDPKIQSNYAIFLSSWNILIDVALAVLPISIFYNLKLDIQKKVALCFLLGLGLIAAVAGCIKVKYLAGLNARSDLTWETYNLFAWSGVELFVIIVCGSIPPIKPVYVKLFQGGIEEKAGYSQYTSDGSNARSKRNSKAFEMDSRRGDDGRFGTSSPYGRSKTAILRQTDIRVTHQEV